MLDSIMEFIKTFVMLFFELFILFIIVSFIVSIIQQIVSEEKIKYFLSKPNQAINYILGMAFGAMTPCHDLRFLPDCIVRFCNVRPALAHAARGLFRQDGQARQHDGFVLVPGTAPSWRRA